MSNQPFQYPCQVTAEKDLKTFSSMNANEDKVIYLVTNDNGTYSFFSKIESGGNPDIVLLIAFNGVLFTR